MKKLLVALVAMLLVAGNAYSQTDSALRELEYFVEKQNRTLPLKVDGLGTVTKVYVDGSYCIFVNEINNIDTFRMHRNRRKYIKTLILKQLSGDPKAVEQAGLLLACKKELKYVYMYKPRGWETEIIVTKKELKKLSK